MQISDIIKDDNDRIFVIDPECFIIFTGDSLDDDRPFIRIGNYEHMPVTLIPLIENIIITDLIIGDPLLEQFNIDITNFDANRYIGTRAIINKYLNFQKHYGLDLENANLVDIETDLPEYNQEKKVSAQQTFIGLFYRDGNFEIKHSNKTLLNLKNLQNTLIDHPKFHQIISEEHRNTERYNESGLVWSDGALLLYRNKQFTAIDLPQHYYRLFTRLGIDPAKLKEIISPSGKIGHLAKLIKWKHTTEGSLNLFTDLTTDVNLLQQLYHKAAIRVQPYTGMNLQSSSGMFISVQNNLSVLKITYPDTKPARKDLNITYILNADQLTKKMKFKSDALMIDYDLFRKNSLFFRGTDLPIIILPSLADKSIKISESQYTHLNNGWHYEFKYLSNLQDMIKHISETLSIEISAESDLTEVCTELLSLTIEGDQLRQYNHNASIKMLSGQTGDRKLATKLEGFLKEHPLENNEQPNYTKIILTFYNGRIYSFIDKFIEKTSDTMDETKTNNYHYSGISPELQQKYNLDGFTERIKNDRERLEALLKLYQNKIDTTLTPPGMSEKIMDLREKINERYDQFKKTGLTGASHSELSKREKLGNHKKLIIIISSSLIISLILVISTLLIKNYYLPKREKRIAIEKIETAKRLRTEAILQYNIKISDRDIFLYVNQIARLNGYAPISIKSFKRNNPNWIYPANKFNTPEGTTIIVKEGDTLWAIAEKILIDRSIIFNQNADIIRKKITDGLDYQLELELAKKNSYSIEHQKIINEITAGKK